MSALRYLCLHGHFYQPPRENPWLEAVEIQDSAAPYHDWNERITRECYGPNTRARLLDGQSRIINLLNNYAWISFNFGPTLLAWMTDGAPDVLRGIVEGDRLSRERRHGHGNALAQVYNHAILPLASPRDKQTQVRWGIADFKHRFGRDPEGMWLAETAADVASLEVLAEAGIRFTVLAPRQAKRWRRVGDSNWADQGGIDPSRSTSAGSRQARPSRCSSTTAPSRRPSPSNGCSTAARSFTAGSCRVSTTAGNTRSWYTSPPTANPTATTTPTATWPSPTSSTG